MLSEIKCNKSTQIFTFLILTMPIINNYSSPINTIGISEMLLILMAPIMLILMVKEKFVFHEYWLFFLYGVFISLVILLFNPDLSEADIFIRLARDSFYVSLILIFAKRFLNISYALKLYKSLVILVCSYICIQCISFYVFHYRMPWIVSGTTLNYSITDTTLYMQLYQRMYEISFRPTSIFLEPAQFAQFIAPYLVFILFPQNKNDKINYLFATFVSGSMLLSTSANGYLYVAMIWGIWFLRYGIKKKELKDTLILLVFTFVSAILFLFLYSSNSSFNQVINRFSNSGTDDMSGKLRMMRGMYFYSAMNPIFKIVGIGFGSFISFKNTYSISTIFEIETEYMNTLSYILVSTGIIGFIIFVYAMYKIYKRGNDRSKVLIVLLLAMSLSASIYSTPIYIIILTLAIYLPKENKSEVSIYLDI